MYVLTNEQMRQVDAETIEHVCPGIELMERAGRGVTEVILHRYGGENRQASIFVGPGNNGGDGLVVARYLAQAGWRVTVHLLKPVEKFSPDAAKNYQRLAEIMSENAHVRQIDAGRPDWIERARQDLADADLVVDAIFGTGVSGAPRGRALEMIELLNDTDLPTVAVDIPSGVAGTSGETPGEAVIATDTLTIGAPKIGTLFHPGRWHCGEVSVIDIGFPEEVIAKHASGVQLLDDAEAAMRLPYRAPDIHKFQAGTVVMVAGSDQFRGAALLAGEAALRAGAGMVYLGVPDVIRSEIDVAVPEVITIPLPSTPEGTVAPEAGAVLRPYLERADAAAIGPGMGRIGPTAEFIRSFVADSGVPTVVDADGLNAFQGQADRLGRLDVPLVITPHSGELGRLVDAESPAGAVERIEHTAETASRLGLTLVHKGAPTLVAGPDGEVWINTTGSSALATGGTGDVLTGLVVGMLAQGAEALDAACVAVHLHGRAGEIAAEEMGTRGVTAGDLLWAVGPAMVEIETLAGE